MTDLFVFGTLLDAELRGLVIGRPWPGRPVRLPDHVRRPVRGRTYPMLAPARGSCVEGLLLEALDDAALDALIAYEGEAYALGPVRVFDAKGRSIAALAFFCRDGVMGDRRPWRLEDWRRRHKRSRLRHLSRLMAGWPMRASLKGLR